MCWLKVGWLDATQTEDIAWQSRADNNYCKFSFLSFNFFIIRPSSFIPFSINLFFNHFTSWKFSLDPTPLEVEMRLYEENVNKTLIQNEERKEDDIDVS